MSARAFGELLERLSTGRPDAVVACEVALSCHERLGGDARAERVGLTVWLALLERSRGSSCLDLRNWAGRPLDEEHALPELAEWRSSLLHSDLAVEAAPSATPSLLVLRGDRLYFRRDHEVEGEVARLLSERWKSVEGLDLPADAEASVRAIASTRASTLTLITGGPGTGKTTAVRAVLEAMQKENPELRIGLAAPTGKAAARLAETLGEESAPVHTLHRLLGLRPGVREEDPDRLALDLLVVDEASMIGLHLLHELLRRLAPSTRLVLVGDAGQLASVEAGSPLADLHALARRAEAPATLRERVVEFTRNWRFPTQPGIGALAAAIRDGDAEAAVSALHSREEDLQPHDFDTGMRVLCDEMVGVWQQARARDDAVAAAEVLRETRVLCALREGPVGVAGVTRRIESRLRAQGVAVDRKAYGGRPILVVENAPSLDLANGDVGVLWEEEGRFVAHFEGRSGQRRAIAYAQLPAHLDAWAMTIHKAQGSEFDDVWLVLPPEDHPLATRDLVYTAVTRARRSLHVVGSDEALRRCVLHERPRLSGLADRMAELLW